MHAVLDGEATADEARELERLLAADPAARAEFEELRAPVRRPSRMPQAHSAGRAGRLRDGMPCRTAHRGRRFGQPFAARRVIGHTMFGISDPRSPRSPRDDRAEQPPNLQEQRHERENAVAKRRIWIGGASPQRPSCSRVSVGFIDFPPGTDRRARSCRRSDTARRRARRRRQAGRLRRAPIGAQVGTVTTPGGRRRVATPARERGAAAPPVTRRARAAPMQCRPDGADARRAARRRCTPTGRRKPTADRTRRRCQRRSDAAQ